MASPQALPCFRCSARFGGPPGTVGPLGDKHGVVAGELGDDGGEFVVALGGREGADRLGDQPAALGVGEVFLDHSEIPFVVGETTFGGRASRAWVGAPFFNLSKTHSEVAVIK